MCHDIYKCYVLKVVGNSIQNAIIRTILHCSVRAKNYHLQWTAKTRHYLFAIKVGVIVDLNKALTK